jgi:predicted acylesterase/phospholipase RssA
LKCWSKSGTQLNTPNLVNEDGRDWMRFSFSGFCVKLSLGIVRMRGFCEQNAGTRRGVVVMAGHESESTAGKTLAHVINGVFKGGGAKGVLYGGAMQALAERGLWFRAVAGSSAGAITATLIAAGLTCDEIIEEAPRGLSGVRRMPLADLVGSPIFRTKHLGTWLEDILVRQVLGTAPVVEGEKSNPVTFAQLHEATGIELYVVSVDVAERQPRVFSWKTSPQVSVTAAVLASSAIPVAFRPGRLDVVDSAGVTATHRMMDGGVWANYPAFVFKDPSFRKFHGLDLVPADSVTIGFTLDTASPEAMGEAVGFKSGTSGSSSDKGSFLPWLFRNPIGRFYFMTILPVVVACQFIYTVNRSGLVFLKDYATRGFLPGPLISAAGAFDGFFSNFTPGLWLAVATLVVFAAVAALLGGTLMDSGVPAMRTLMAVGTDVPYWVGAAEGDHVIRLQVPAWLDTTSFKLSKTQVNQAVGIGREQAIGQLLTVIPPGTTEGQHHG